MRYLISKIILFLAVTMSPVLAKAESCNSFSDFADLSKWTGERSSYCSAGARVRGVRISQTYYGSGDWDSNGMGMQCCSIDNVTNPTSDYCEEKWIATTNLGSWAGDKAGACDARAGGYVAGFRLFTDDRGSDFQSNYLSVRCCYPQTPPAETCGNFILIANGNNHWSGTNTGSCGTPGGYIREVKFTQHWWNSGDKESNGLEIRCCSFTAPTPIPNCSPAPASTCTAMGHSFYNPSGSQTSASCSYSGDVAAFDNWTATGSGCECRSRSGCDGSGVCTPSGSVDDVGAACGISCACGGTVDEKECRPINCTPGNSNSGSTTSGSTTSGSSTSGSGGTSAGSTTSTPPTPTPTPHITCPSGSTDDPANYNNCFCTVKGQVFTPSGSSGSCACPSGYEVVITDQATSKAECRPVVTAEFFRNSSAISNNYPVCGTGRAPTDAARVVLKGASSTVPNSSDVIAGPQGYPYLYATGSGTAPVYNYKNYDHCACTWKDFPLSPTKQSTTAPSTVSGGKLRFYPDDLALISTQDDAATVNYGAVAIAKSEAVDGRLGVVYSTGYSQCGCPNVNEEMVPIDSTDPYASGVTCRPAVAVSPYRKLVLYKPELHDPDPSRTQVINRSNEVIHASGHVIGKVLLRKSAVDWTPQLYQRKIWACEYPFTVDVASKECKFDPAKNACNEGNGSEIAPSEVSQNVSGPSKSDQFLNAVNKKLACCLNSFGAIGASVKFDCVQNEIKNYADFDALWSSADTAAQGGQLNAMVLTNPQGKWMSGFYTLDGSRCEGFSEFAGTIQPGVVNPADGIAAQMNRAQGKLDPNAFQSKGSAIPLPGSGAGGGSGAYSYMLGKMIGLGKTVPSTAGERRRCPVLVRAAMSVECPPVGGSPLATYNGQCAAAKDIYVHIRAEQVWEIAGQPKMKTVDTVVDVSSDGKRVNAGEISIDRIISNKYGNACPPGQISDSGGCHY